LGEGAGVGAGGFGTWNLGLEGIAEMCLLDSSVCVLKTKSQEEVDGWVKLAEMRDVERKVEGGKVGEKLFGCC
jgi:hypothetical protein